MAEFSEIARQYNRMCESYKNTGCVDCPMRSLGSLGLKKLCKDAAFFTPDTFVHVVEKWAEEHPEPQYPTWREFLEFEGVLEHEDDHSTAGIVIARERISAEIAEKLGIGPEG